MNQIDPLPGKSQDVRRWRGSLNGIVAGLLVACMAFGVLAVYLGSAQSARAFLRGETLVVLDSHIQIDVPVGLSDVHANFQITNVSLSSVGLLGATTSCSCISDSNSFPVSLQPGESIDLTFRIQREIQADGSEVSETIRLLTDRRDVVKSLVVRLVPESSTPNSTGDSPENRTASQR